MGKGVSGFYAGWKRVKGSLGETTPSAQKKRSF